MGCNSSKNAETSNQNKPEEQPTQDEKNTGNVKLLILA